MRVVSIPLGKVFGSRGSHDGVKQGVINRHQLVKLGTFIEKALRGMDCSDPYLRLFLVSWTKSLPFSSSVIISEP